MGRYSYQRNLLPQTTQLDIRDPSNVVPLRNRDEFGTSVITGLDYLISSNWLSSFRFGWVQNKTNLVGTKPSIVGDMLGLPGTSSSIGAVSLDLSILSEPIDAAAQSARTQITRDRNIQFSNRTIWLKGKHNVSFGGEFRVLPFLFNHNDQATFLTGPIVLLDSGNFLSIPATNRPPSCAGAVTTNCLLAADVGRWNDLYAVTLGMVDNVNIVGARDGALQPLPLGTDLISDTTMRYFQFHFEDTWRMRPDLTLTYGLTYSWQTPLTEKLDRIALITDLNTGEVFSAESYLQAKEQAARQGQVFNPQIGVRPLNDSSRDTLADTDYSNIGPRVAVAWSPQFKNGLLGSSHRSAHGGERRLRHRLRPREHDLGAPPRSLRHRLRSGAANPRSVLQRVRVRPARAAIRPLAPGTARQSAFRTGVDGAIPIPPFTGGTSPIVPAVLSGGTSFATDPDRKIGRNYAFDVTVQREVPGRMIVEVGYVGRLGRDLPQGLDLDASPYFFKDSASGQTFAQAYDAVALALRSNAAAAATLPSQAWFENQLPGLSGTTASAACRPPAVAAALTSTQCLAVAAGEPVSKQRRQQPVPADEPVSAR